MRRGSLVSICFEVLGCFTEEVRTEAGAARRDGVVVSQEDVVGYEVRLVAEEALEITEAQGSSVLVVVVVAVAVAEDSGRSWWLKRVKGWK